MGSRLEANSERVSKRIQNHIFVDEEGEEYKDSSFGGFSDYFRRKKIKLQNLDAQIRSESQRNPPIFRGIVCHVNGYTQPTLNDLHRMIVSHGGGFMQYLDGKTTVTHIIASSLTPKKAEEFKRYRIIKPQWVVDSVNSGQLQPWHFYRVVDEGQGQKVLQFEDGKLGSQASKRRQGYRDQTEASWYTKQLSDKTSLEIDQDQVPDSFSPIVSDDNKPRQIEAKDPRNADTHGLMDASDDDSVSQEFGTARQAFEETGENIGRDEDDGSIHTREEIEDVAESGLKRKRESSLDGEPPAKKPSVAKSKLTAEEHNSILLSDPSIRKSSVLNPEFLEQYYRESRLHHLSTWKSELKSQMQALTASKTPSQKAQREKRPSGARRYILHVDFDSFFVAISLKKHPQYADMPACVAHGSGNNCEIASCNYPARKFGVKNGMWMKHAQDLCKGLKVLPYDFPAYEAASRLFYEAVIATECTVQSISIDEALVDVSSLCIAAGGHDGKGVREGSIWREQDKADELAQSIRDQVKEQTGCNVSVGIGSNVLLAKLALRKAKPAGQHQVKPEEVLDFLAGLEVTSLPGFAWNLGNKLDDNGIKYVKDVRELTRERLVTILGPKTGEKLWNYSRGIDKTEVGDQVVRKSVSAEVNWGVRFENNEQVHDFIENLCGELERRLLKEGVKGRQLTMKVMRRSADAPLDPPKHLGHGKCDTYNKSVVLGVATNTKAVLAKEALSMMQAFKFSPGELRGLGVQMQKIEPLKSTCNENPNASSQRLLQFVKPALNNSALANISQAGKQERQLPQALLSTKQDRSNRKPPIFQRETQGADEVSESDQIVDDPETPRKDQKAVAPAFDHHTPTKKPLNTMGTQFLLPTQVDPEVLKELPGDIRSRLARQQRHESPYEQALLDESLHQHATEAGLPNGSQLDKETLDSLPADIRAEVLAQYPSPVRNQIARRNAQQSVLPQSPRKDRMLPTSKRPIIQPRGRGRPKGSTNLSTRLRAAASRAKTLTQANFVTGAREAFESGTDSEGNVGLDSDFLAALPDDIREEVVEQHRAQRLKRTSGLQVQKKHLSRRRDADNNALQALRGERIFSLPAKPSTPTFTTAKLTALQDLRQAMHEWILEFPEDEGGPYEEDVEALGRYLTNVVTQEHDLDKASSIVKWLGTVLSEQSPSWTKALESLTEHVQRAVRERGLGELDFG